VSATRSFPESFLFGCATSAYQVEGGIRNDWTLWEEDDRLKVKGARCGRATDHWNLWERDFGLLAELGASAYRFSIEWSRVEPEPGRWDDDALARYARMIDALRARNIEPFVTLLHFTHPTWFHASSPWHDRKQGCVDTFARFVARVADALGERVRFWTVLNEPGVWLAGAYLAGVIPPGRKHLGQLTVAFSNLVRAHGAAHAILKGRFGERAQVGVAHNVVRFHPARAAHAGDRLAAHYADRVYNRAFPRAVKSKLDFIGVNYYSRMFIKLTPFSRARFEPFYEDRGGLGVSDLGWEIHPGGFTEALLEMAQYGLPIYVTENGIDDRDDSRRSAFLYDHLAALLDARAAGADIRGYLHWSLLDNFEWLEAYGPRFGLYRVDYETLERRPTSAAKLYAEIIRARALPSARPEVRIKRGNGPTPAF
jgi:beta-glucosidase